MSGFNTFNEIKPPDYSNPFLAKVVFNNDPDKLQRIKVTIPGVLEGKTDDLPWIAPVLYSPFGVTASAGVVHVPAVGSFAVVSFQDGQLYYGLGIGSLAIKDYTPDPILLTNYPNRRGWKDPSGNLFYIDNKSGSVTVHFKHISGTTIDISNSGRVTVHAENDLYVTAPNVNITADVQITGDITHDGNTTHTGDTTQTGNIAVTGGITATGDIVAGTISLKHHVHGGVDTGGSDTQGPH